MPKAQSQPNDGKTQRQKFIEQPVTLALTATKTRSPRGAQDCDRSRQQAEEGCPQIQVNTPRRMTAESLDPSARRKIPHEFPGL